MNRPDALVERFLVCPRCHGGFIPSGARLVCLRRDCGFEARVVDGIVDVMANGAGASFFDSKVPVMVHGADEPGAHAVFYAQQAQVAERSLMSSGVIVDVGCGPRLMYKRPAHAVVIGIDLSLESLRHNTDVDIRVFGSATHLPVGTRSVDVVVCFYLFHHVVGESRASNAALLRQAFRECSRVLKAGGRLMVFDVAPWSVVWLAEQLAWDVLRRLLGRSLDMYFWSHRALQRLAVESLPGGTTLITQTFQVSPWTMFPPAFALQRLRIPRLLYPFDVCLFQWRMPHREEA